MLPATISHYVVTGWYELTLRTAMVTVDFFCSFSHFVTRTQLTRKWRESSLQIPTCEFNGTQWNIPKRNALGHTDWWKHSFRGSSLWRAKLAQLTFDRFQSVRGLLFCFLVVMFQVLFLSETARWIVWNSESYDVQSHLVKHYGDEINEISYRINRIDWIWFNYYNFSILNSVFSATEVLIIMCFRREHLAFSSRAATHLKCYRAAVEPPNDHTMGTPGS